MSSFLYHHHDADDDSQFYRDMSKVRVVARIRPMTDREKSRGCRVKLYPMQDASTVGENSISSFDDGLLSDLLSAADENDLNLPSLLRPTVEIIDTSSNLYTPSGKTDKQQQQQLDSYQDSTPLVSNSRSYDFDNEPSTPVAPQEQQQQQQQPPRYSFSDDAVSVHTNTDHSVTIASSILTESNGQQRKFDFDAVLPMRAKQEDVYQQTVGDAVKGNVLKGFNTTIIAYGQTGSGKTFTMAGPHDGLWAAGGALPASPVSDTRSSARSPRASHYNGSYYSNGKYNASSPRTPDRASPKSPRNVTNSIEDDDGVIPRAIRDLFEAKRQTHSRVTIALTFVEIYNDELRDLLIDGPSTLKLRDQGDEVVLQGLQSVPVESIRQVKELMDEGTLRRTTGSTRLNEHSSRSHAICTLTVTVHSHPILGGTKAKLTLVDLAGSERIKDTGVVGLQKQESININKDLFVLGKVVSALSEQKSGAPSRHIPYRDSKLTRLLRDSLGGNCFTVLIACVSPADINIDESINTLRYAERSRAITNAVSANMLPSSISPAEAAAMRAENNQLKAQVNKLKKKVKNLELQQLDPLAAETNVTLQNEITSLQDKLRQAKCEAKIARESSKSVALIADRWKSRFDKLQQQVASMPAENHTKATPPPPPPPKQTPKLVANNKTDEASNGSCDLSALLESDSSLVDEISVKNGNNKTKTDDDADNKSTVEVRIAEIDAELKTKQTEIDRLHDANKQLSSQVVELQTTNMELQCKMASNSDSSPPSLRLSPGSYSTESASTAHHTTEDKPSSILEQQQLLVMTERCARSVQAARALIDENAMVRKENTRLAEQNAELLRMLEMLNVSSSRRKVDSSSVLNNGKNTDTNATDSASDAVTPRQSNGVSNISSSGGNYEAAIPARTSMQTIDDDGERSSGSDDSIIRAQAEKMLQLADHAIDQGRFASFSSRDSMCSSAYSSEASEFRPPTGHPHDQRHYSDESDGPVDQSVVISNLGQVNDTICRCESSVLKNSAKHAEFYLPNVGVSCSCGKRDTMSETIVGDPTLLRNILRPWQVDFLATIRIETAQSLVTLYKRRGRKLAKAMRRWRKEQGLKSIKTTSCNVALHIWSRTCEAVIKSVKSQKKRGIDKPRRPELLNVAAFTSVRTVSTLGIGSIIEDNEDDYKDEEI